MYSLNFNTQQYNNYNTVKAVSTTKVEKNEHVKENKTSFTSNPIMTQIPYNPALTASRLRTELISKDEKNKYNHLVSISDKETKKNLNMLLKTGILLNSDSNDNSTTLDNLYKIATTQRAQGLSGDVILKNTIDTLANPHMITQQFGNIPSKYRAQVEAVEKNKNDNPAKALSFSGASDIDVEHSGTCVASSIEFNLADKHPAFQNFPTSYYADWQWWDILNEATAVDLTAMRTLTPIIQSIDTYEVNRKLGIAFEANAGKGKLFVLCVNPEKNKEERLAMRQLLTSVQEYVTSAQFNPEVTLPLHELDALFMMNGMQQKNVRSNEAVKQLLNQ